MYIFNNPSKLQSCGTDLAKGGHYNDTNRRPPVGGGVLDAGARKGQKGAPRNTKNRARRRRHCTLALHFDKHLKLRTADSSPALIRCMRILCSSRASWTK